MAKLSNFGSDSCFTQPATPKLVLVFQCVLANIELDPTDKLTFRHVCRAARDLHDQHARTVRFKANSLQGPSALNLLSSDDVAAAIRGILARGCRPTTMIIEKPPPPYKLLHETKLLTFLTSWAEAASVTDLLLYIDLPLTPAVVSAIANLSPKLARVVLVCGEDDQALPAPPTDDLAAAAAAGEELLRLLGPRLTRLELRMFDGSQYAWPTRAFRGLSYCTALKELELAFFDDLLPSDGVPADLLLLQSIAPLSGLRSLQLTDDCHRRGWPRVEPPTPAERLASAPALESCLSGLTALTRLEMHLARLQHYPNRQGYAGVYYHVGGLDDQILELQRQEQPAVAATLEAAAAAESRALAAAARCMPGLVELRTPAVVHAADLSTLTTLTYLRCGLISMPGEAAAAVPRDAASGYKIVVPPQLQRLETHAPLPVRTAAALRAPPVEGVDQVPCSLMAGGRLWGCNASPWCLDFSDDAEQQGSLTADAVDALRRAVAALSGFRFRPFMHVSWRPDEEERGVRVRMKYNDSVEPPRAPDGSNGSHCRAWLGELACLELEALCLDGFTMSPVDILGLGRCMTSVQVLDLRGCDYSVASLPLLAGMQRLRELQLSIEFWQYSDAWSDRQEIMAAFLGLTSPLTTPTGGPGGALQNPGIEGSSHVGPLPKLQLISIVCKEGSEPEIALLEDAVTPAREEFRRWNAYGRLEVTSG
ncbi:hypothetical protein Agub_g6858 [Astrephomene gubernaculifera]|uniref:Uncharacterized protein n=1 Tax=Astrephomene gubernaculifera TaxID=47775 RepID=A0AAD3DP44_9CHLO|nr:hypothetical protein Agub_g6858 [Astrephomene gubernaculifera]